MANRKAHKQRMPLSVDYLRAHTVGELKPLAGPIRVVNYDPTWPDMFRQEAATIRHALGARALRIEHVGSTAVPDLPAKPVIDMILVVADSTEEAAYVGPLEKAGYQLRIRESDWYEHRMLTGRSEYLNLHVFSAGCPEIERMLMFRDWLRANKSDRELYAQSKRMLAEQNWKYTQNYADAKTAVINEIMSRALQSRRRETPKECPP
jgi:GrpB-like predicted nucleotidyltransferase (UPF0157 family)